MTNQVASHEEAARVDILSPEPTPKRPELDEILTVWPEIGGFNIGTWPVVTSAKTRTAPEDLHLEGVGHPTAATGGTLSPTTAHPKATVPAIGSRLLSTMAVSLATVYDWFAGPAWSEQEHRRRVLAEAEAELRAWRLI